MPKPKVSPFTKARLVTLQPRATILLRDYALAFLRHCDALRDTSGGDGDDIARRQAYEAMSKNLNMSIGKVKMCLPQFRKVFYQCMLDIAWRDGGDLQDAPYWARLVELKLNVLPRALEEVALHRHRRSKKLTPSGALRLMVAYCTRHRALCSSALYTELRVALRCGAAATQLHHVWVSAQRVCMRQLAALCRAGDVPGRDPAAPLPRMSRTAWRVVDLVLTYTDVDTHTVLTDESVTLYDELQALTTLFTLVQKHRVEGAGAGAGGAQLAAAWAALHREYTAGGAVTSLLVLQRRWHELKLQARARLARYWQAPARAPPAAPPAPALLHLDVVRKYPHVALGPAPCWRRLVAAGQVHQQPRDHRDLELERDPAGDEDVDAPPPIPTPPPPADDDDVLLVEKRVETIDVDSASDTENQLVIDDTTAERVQKHGSTDAATDETRTAAGAPDDGTSTASTVGQLVNVASVEMINNRYQESINEQSSEAIKDIATPGTSAGEHIDTGQTLAILQTLDPSKVRAEIIFESDSDDEPMSNITQNSLNETQIVISDVTSRANDTSDIAQHEHAYSYTGNITINDSPSELQKLLQNNNETTKVKDEDSETAQTDTDTSISYNKTGEITTEMDSGNSVVTPILSSDASNSGSEDVTMQDVATTSAENSASRTGIIDNSEFGNIAKDSYINIKVEGSDSENRIVINDNINNQNTLEVSEARGTQSIGEDYEREVGQNYVDPKLIMETRVDLIRVHDTTTWRQHSESNKYIDINRVNVAQFQPVTKNNGNVFIEIEINGIAKAENEASTDTVDIDMEQLVPQRSLAFDETDLIVNSSDEEQTDNDESADRDSHTSDTLSADDASAACDEPDDSTSSSSDDSSDEYVPMEELIEVKRKARGPKSMATGVFEWSANYDIVFSGEGGRKKRGSRRSERVAKRVQLPDIVEVRRVNSNILTAQVAPTPAGAGASIFASENSSSNTESVSADKPADYQLDQASADSPTYLSATADKPGGHSVSADTPAEQSGSGLADGQWLELQPTRRELNNVLNKLTSELRARGLVCGLPAPAYCCAARRHRSVNDARRRICARAPEIQLHVHAGACACCCRHLVAHAQQHARLGADVARLHHELRRLLRVPASHTPHKPGSGSFKEASGSSKKKKTRKKENKSKQNTETTVTESTAAPPHTDLTGLAEWERQKSLNAQYFHINTGSGRKRRSDAADKDGDKRPTTTESTHTIVIEAPSDEIPNKNNEPNPDVVVINDDDDENDSQSIPQPTRVAAANVGALRARKRVIAPRDVGSPPSKIMKLAMCPTSKQLSLVVADMKDSQPKYRKLVKLQSKPQSLLKPIRLTRVVAKVASLNNINTSASAQSVSSGGASVSDVTGALMRVRNSVSGAWITVPSGGTGTLMGVASGGAGTLVSVPSSSAGTLMSVPNNGAGTLMSVSNNGAGTLMSVTNSVAGTLMSVTKSVTGTLMSVTNSVSGTLITVPKGRASSLIRVTSGGAGTLMSVPNNGAGTLMSVPTSGAGTLVSLPNNGAGTLMSLPSGGAGTLMSVPNNGAATLMSVPNSGSGTLMSVPNNGAGTLMSVPNSVAGTFMSMSSGGAGTLMSMPGGGVGTLMNVPSCGAGTLMSVPNGGAGTLMSVPSGGAGTLMSVSSGGAGTLMSVPSGGAGTLMSVPGGGAGTLMTVPSGGAGKLMSAPSGGAGALMSVPSGGAGTLSVPGGGAGTLMSVPSGGAGTLMSVPSGGAGTLMSVPSGGVGTLMCVSSGRAGTLMSVPSGGAGTLMSVPSGGAGTLMSVPSGEAGTLMSVPGGGAGTLMSVPSGVVGTLMSVPSGGAGTLMSVPSGGVGTLMSVPSGGAGTLMSVPSGGAGTLMSVPGGGAGTLMSMPSGGAGTLMSVPSGEAGTLMSVPSGGAGTLMSVPSGGAGTLMSVPSGGAGTLMSVPGGGASTLMSMPNSVSGTLMNVSSSGAGTLRSVSSVSCGGTGTLMSVSSGGTATVTSASNAIAGTLKTVPKAGAGKLVSAVKYRSIAPSSAASTVAVSATSAVAVSAPSAVAVSVPSAVAVSASSAVAVSAPSAVAVSVPSAVAVSASSAMVANAPWRVNL